VGIRGSVSRCFIFASMVRCLIFAGFIRGFFWRLRRIQLASTYKVLIFWLFVLLFGRPEKPVNWS
jgi:hypothetical protein